MEFPYEGAGVLDQIVAVRTPRKVEVNNAHSFIPAIKVAIKDHCGSDARATDAMVFKVSNKRKEITFTHALPDWVKAGCLIVFTGK